MMLVANPAALADEATRRDTGSAPASAAPKFFATLTPPQLQTGPGDATPEQIESAQNAKESRPATQDPEGHWGETQEGFQLSVRFEKENFRAGEPIVATVLIRNATNKNVYYRDFVGLREDSPVCQFDVLDEQQKPVLRLTANAPDDITDGPHITRALKPGTQCRYDVKLDARFNLNQPGTFSIRARRWVHKLQGDGYVQLKSEPAPITILRPELTAKKSDTAATSISTK